jgi:hypothetical protein
MRLSSIGWLVLLGTGCSGTGSNTSDAQPVDAAPDAAPDATAIVPGPLITIRALGTPPALIAYRDGLTAAWQTPATTSTGYEMMVHGPYIASSTCDDRRDNITTFQIARTPDDDRTLSIQCGLAIGPLVHVTGQMVQPGEVTVGHTASSSSTPNWSFDIPVEPGTHDVFAMTADRVEIRRDVAIAGSIALTPAFDVDAAGADRVATAFSISGAAPGELTTVLPAVQTAHGFALLDVPLTGDPAKQKLVPPSLLRPSEFHKLSIAAGVLAPSGPPSATRRVLRRWSDGQSTSFALPPTLGAIAYEAANGTLVASWSAAPEFYLVQGVARSLLSSGRRLRSIAVDASKQFIEASQPSLPFDVDIPGFKSDWRVDYSKEYTRELTMLISRGATPDERDESTITETVNLGQPPV